MFVGLVAYCVFVSCCSDCVLLSVLVVSIAHCPVTFMLAPLHVSVVTGSGLWDAVVCL